MKIGEGKVGIRRFCGFLNLLKCDIPTKKAFPKKEGFLQSILINHFIAYAISIRRFGSTLASSRFGNSIFKTPSV